LTALEYMEEDIVETGEKQNKVIDDRRAEDEIKEAYNEDADDIEEE